MKIKILSLILLFFLINQTCTSTKIKNSIESKPYRNYYKLVSKADSLFFIKKHKESYDILNELFKKTTPINTFRFKEYYVFLMLKHKLGKNISKSEIKDLITVYGIKKNSLTRDLIINLYYTKYSFTNNEYDSLRKQYINNLNLDLRKKIGELVKDDQYYRKEYTEEDKWDKIRASNALIEKELYALFEKGIYPNSRVVGDSFLDDINPDIETLLLHTSDSIRLNYFLPKIKEFVLAGKCNPYIYITMLDQYEIYNEKPQLYGTFNLSKIPVSKYAYYTDNRNKLDIGLPSVEFDIWWENLPK